MRGPIEQLLSERLFEFRDLHAQGGLNDVQLARRPGHVSLAGKAEEVVQLLQIHRVHLQCINLSD